MRRMLLATVVVVLVGTLAVVAAASIATAPQTARSGGPGPGAPEPAAPDSGPFALAAEQAPAPHGDGYFEAAADRHRAAAAIRRDKRASVPPRRLTHGVIAERVARDLADRLDVEEDRMRSTLASVGRDTLGRSDVRDRSTWADRKREALAELARELDKPVAVVERAARNELRSKLRIGVTFGAVSARGRTLALACFDTPERCDVAALRRAIRWNSR